MSKYNAICDKLVPVDLESGGFAPKPKWLNGIARAAIKKKVEAWNLHRRRTNRSYQNYVTMRNRSVDAIRQAKYSFEKSIAREVKNGDKNSFYSYARSQSSIKKGVSRVLKEDGTVTQNNKETADVMDR